MTARAKQTAAVAKQTAVSAARRKALEEEKRVKISLEAARLREQGLGFYDIAIALGLPESQAKNMVAEVIAKSSELVSEGERRNHTLMELARLDALQSAHWPEALGHGTYTDPITGEEVNRRPSTKSADLVLKIIDRRINLLGLGQQEKTVTATTVVVGGTSEEYIRALQSIAAREHMDGEVTDGF